MSRRSLWLASKRTWCAVLIATAATVGPTAPSANAQTTAQVDVSEGDVSAEVSVAEMFEMQMLINHFSQLF